MCFWDPVYRAGVYMQLLEDRAISKISRAENHIMLDHYISQFSPDHCKIYSSHNFTVANSTISVQGEYIILKRTGFVRRRRHSVKDARPNVMITLTVKLSTEKIPEIKVDKLEGGCERVIIDEENEYGQMVIYDESMFNIFVYAVNTDNDRANDKDSNDKNENEPKIDIKKRHIPLYCDPRAAHKMITDKLNRVGDFFIIRNIYFHILFLGADSK